MHKTEQHMLLKSEILFYYSAVFFSQQKRRFWLISQTKSAWGLYNRDLAWTPINAKNETHDNSQVFEWVLSSLGILYCEFIFISWTFFSCISWVGQSMNLRSQRNVDLIEKLCV